MNFHRFYEVFSEAVSFFSIVGELYNFFSASTYRWDKLNENLAKHQLIIKKQSHTRWSARHDAVRALAKGSASVKEALLQTRLEAECISEKLDTLEYALVCLLRYDLLERVHCANLSLQTVKLSLQ